MKGRKNLFRKCIVCFLAGIFAVSAVGCAKEKKEEKPQTGNVGEQTDNVGAREVYNGTHVFDITETSNYLVKDGKTDYKIVIPERCGTYVQQAKTEFVYLFKEATGVTLPAITDAEVTAHTAEGKYISIGRTKLLETSGVEVDYEKLGRDGGRIQTKDNSIYIVGGLDKGTLYTVYTFMQLAFHFEQYYINCYEMDRGISDVKLMNYNVTDIPDIAIRANDTGLLWINSTDYDENNARYRMKMGTKLWDRIFPIHSEMGNRDSESLQVHNSFMFLPPHIYQEEHNEWYGINGTGTANQLCYTARGNEEEFELMAQECAKKIEQSLVWYNPEEYPEYNVATLTMEDNALICSCDKCSELKIHYGTDAAAATIFINRVAELVDVWMQDPANAAYKRDDFHLIFFAYSVMTKAPAVYNEKKGAWEPIDDKVKFRDNVGLYYAPISDLAYEMDFFDEINESGKDNFDAWNSISDYTYYWTYATNFQQYAYIYDSFNFYSGDFYAFLANRSGKYIFAQQQHDQTGTSTAWHNLKFYLNAKLSWDSSLNEEELINNWFNAMYKEAAPVMKDLFYKERGWAKYVYEKYDMITYDTVYNKVAERKFWPYPVLKSWTKQCDEAMSLLSAYQTSDPDLYEDLFERVYAEWIFPAYAILSLYDNGSMSQADRTAMIRQFQEVLDNVDPYGTMQWTDYSGTYRDFIDNL